MIAHLRLACVVAALGALAGATVASSAVASAAVASAAEAPRRAHAENLVVYTGRREALIAPVLKAFEAETGIAVTVKSGSNAALAQAIIAEATRPQASVFISQDAPTCEVLRSRGVLEPTPSGVVNAIPARFRAVDNSWIGLSGRVRVLMYNRDLVTPQAAPRSVLDLTKPEWRGKVAIASAKEASVASWAGALILQLGRARAQSYLTALTANGLTVLPSHTDVRKAVARGEFAVGMVNHYYYHLTSGEGGKVGVVYPDQQRTVRVKVRVRDASGRVRTVIRGRKEPKNPLGALFNAATACLVKGGPAQTQARLLVDYLVSGRAQVLFSELNYEYPLRAGLSPTNGVKPLRQVLQAPVDLRKIDGVAGTEILNAAGIQ